LHFPLKPRTTVHGHHSHHDAQHGMLLFALVFLYFGFEGPMLLTSRSRIHFHLLSPNACWVYPSNLEVLCQIVCRHYFSTLALNSSFSQSPIFSRHHEISQLFRVHPWAPFPSCECFHQFYGQGINHTMMICHFLDHSVDCQDCEGQVCPASALGSLSAALSISIRPLSVRLHSPAPIFIPNNFANSFLYFSLRTSALSSELSLVSELS
jgi:hypothetical protein